MLNVLNLSEHIFQMPLDQCMKWSVWLTMYDGLNTPIREIRYTDVVKFVLESCKC